MGGGAPRARVRAGSGASHLRAAPEARGCVSVKRRRERVGLRSYRALAVASRGGCAKHGIAAVSFRWSLTPLSSASGLLLAALEAALRRAPLCAGSWAGQ